jgi:thioredoxin reductase
VQGIVEGLPKIGAYGVHAAKIRRAGVPFFLQHTIVEARGESKVEKAVIAQAENFKPIPGTERIVDTDVICIAAGLRPLSELASMAGAKQIYIPQLGGWMPLHDENMQSSIEGLYVAGDTAGIEEASTAMEEGRLAGISMAESLGFINQRESEEKKTVVRQRLDSLRQGPFGQKRMDAKDRILGESMQDE